MTKYGGQTGMSTGCVVSISCSHELMECLRRISFLSHLISMSYMGKDVLWQGGARRAACSIGLSISVQ
jgi:hypothetical protein